MNVSFNITINHPLEWIAAGALAFWSMFGLFALVMNLYRAKLQGKLTRTQYVIGFPYFVVGGLLDVALNWSIGSLILLDLPREAVMTAHMQRLRKEEPDSWGAKVSAWICDQGLDSLDPSGDHC